MSSPKAVNNNPTACHDIIQTPRTDLHKLIDFWYLQVLKMFSFLYCKKCLSKDMHIFIGFGREYYSIDGQQ